MTRAASCCQHSRQVIWPTFFVQSLFLVQITLPLCAALVRVHCHSKSLSICATPRKLCTADVLCLLGDSQVRAFNVERAHEEAPSPLRVWTDFDSRTKKIAFHPVCNAILLQGGRTDALFIEMQENLHTFFCGSEDGTVRQFDLREPTSQVVLTMYSGEHISEVYSIATDGPTLACAGTDPVVRLYDMRMFSTGVEQSQVMKRLAPLHKYHKKKTLFGSEGHITGMSFLHIRLGWRNLLTPLLRNRV
jgi:WD40 repeat protein